MRLEICLLALELGEFLAEALLGLLEQALDLILIVGEPTLSHHILDRILDQILDGGQIQHTDTIALRCDGCSSHQP